jgi:hypothetical protein
MRRCDVVRPEAPMVQQAASGSGDTRWFPGRRIAHVDQRGSVVLYDTQTGERIDTQLPVWERRCGGWRVVGF